MSYCRIFLLMSALLMTCMDSFAQEEPVAPRGKLIYCSYASDRHAGQGKSYCELIADVGKRPQVVVSLYNNCFYREAVHKTLMSRSRMSSGCSNYWRNSRSTS